MIDEVTRAYVAGFLDGDGSIMAFIEPRTDLRLGYRIRVIIKFSQHARHRSELEMLQARLGGIGYISDFLDGTSEYAIKAYEEVNKVLGWVKPYVVFKKEQVELAQCLQEKLAKLHTQDDLLEAAELADKLSALNYTSKSRSRKHTAQSIRSATRND